MSDDQRERALAEAYDLSLVYLAVLPDRHVGPRANAASLRERLSPVLPDSGEDPTSVVSALAAAIDPGLVASAGPRYFGFVVGGILPAAAAADWLTTTWAQNGALHALSPAAAAAEQVAGEWMLDLLGLPADASFGLPTGAGLGNAVGLAAGRHAVLARAGWDVEARGLYGAPEVEVVIGEEAHATVLTALQYLGLGRERVRRIGTDDQGRMRIDELAAAIGSTEAPVVVAAQAGNVNTGAFDPIGEVADLLAARPNTWLHVDGAFGLWAAVSPALRHLVQGVERADSWSTDAHKWLNAGYDCGFVAVRDPEAHRSAMAATAPYLMRSDQRESWEYVLDSSRRARGFALYAAIRSLGRDGVRELVERCCRLAQRMAEQLAAGGVEVLNSVVLNQVLIRFGDDERTQAVIGRVQADGTAWMGGTSWHGAAAMRISVSNWSTTEADADASVQAILRAASAGAS
ncbi:MAG TPA: aminotransferase class V-fold PLP-dependent enzyme [Candidatus Limnocylindrales bacterium]|nr:aminotransferase class V-fold PLP-dependent enzyme [Candidatus Limnocylindrales bacterium]